MLIRKSNEAQKVRRSREENKDEEVKESNKDYEISYLKKEVATLKEELRVNRDNVEKNDKYADLLNYLFHKGIIDEEGIFLSKIEEDLE